MFVKGSLFMLLAILLSACQPMRATTSTAATPATPAPATPVTVTFLVSGGPAEQAAYAAVVEAFHAKQAGIRVEMAAVPGTSDFLTRLTTDFAAGAPPDVFLINYRRMTQFYNRDAIEPLGPMLQASTVMQEADFFAVALDAFRDSRGTLVCMPQNISSQVVYFNRELFAQAGIAEPTANWTWAELRQIAQQLTLPDTNGDGFPEQHGLGLEPALIRMVPWIWQNGGAVVDDVRTPTRLTLDDPATLAAMQFVVEMVLQDGSIPNPDAAAIAAIPDRFLAGKLAMYIDSRVFTPTLRETASFDWDVAPLPQGQQRANVLHSDGYCMASASQVKTAAWAFIEYALGAEGQSIASQLGRTVPSHVAVASSSAFLDPTQPPASAQVWLDNMAQNMGVLPKVENWNAIERSAAVELEMVYLGQQSLDAAIANIDVIASNGFIPIK